MHGDIFKDRSKNSPMFKMELFPNIGDGRVYNQWTVVFACCMDENGHALKVASDMISCFQDMF